MKIVDAVRLLFANAEQIEYPLSTSDPHHIAVASALMALKKLIEAHDSLAPDWSKLPDWADWYAIDANGDAYAYAYKPYNRPEMSEWEAAGRRNNENTVRLISMERIEDGIDWRDCVWERQIDEE